MTNKMTYCRLTFLILRKSKNIDVFAFLVLIAMFGYAGERSGEKMNFNIPQIIRSNSYFVLKSIIR